MYFIVVKWQPKPEHVEDWPELVREFTESTRAEPGNLWFEWSRSLEDPSTYVLVEAFSDEPDGDGKDGAAHHVASPHFAKATAELGQYLTATPRIISRKVDGAAWDEMGEIKVG